MNKKLVAAAVASALAVPMAAHAVKFETSGQVNRAVMVADDGVQSDVLHVDGESSGSRFRFTGSEDIGNGLTAGVNFEIELQSNDASVVDVDQQGDVQTFRERHVNVYFSGDFGKLTMGQASDATDGAAFADLNNAWFTVENFPDFGGGVDFRDKNDLTSGFQTTGITVADVNPSFDGGRRDTLRYDTPAIGPLSAAVSHSTDSRVDAMVKLAGSVAGGAYDLRGGWNNTGDGLWVVSGSFKFAQGTSITGAWGQQSFDDVVLAGTTFRTPDAEYFYIKLGHDWGNNSVAAHYKSSEDTAAIAGTPGFTQCSGGSVAGAVVTLDTCGGTAWAVGFSHTMPKPKVDLYAGYQFFELDDTAPGLSVEDISVFVVGSRIKFD